MRIHSIFLLACAPVLLSAQRTPFTYEDMLMLDRISGLSVNGAGTHALYNLRVTDMEHNRGVSSLWLKELAPTGTPERRLQVSDSGAYNARWMPDGRSFAFLSARGGVAGMQLWRTDIEGRRAEQLTRLPLGIEAYRIMPDGTGAVVALSVSPSATEDEIGLTVRRHAERPMGSGTVYDRVFVRHWDTWKDGTRSHLFHVNFASGEITPLTPGFDGDIPSKPFGDEGDLDIAPDGRTVYFSARVAGRTEPWSTNFDVYSVPVTGGPLSNLTEANKAWDASPRLSPDGRTLAYKAMRRPGFEADRFEVILRDLTSGEVRPLTTTWDRSVGEMQWAPDGKELLVTADDVGAHRLFGIDVKSGKVTTRSKDGHIDAFQKTPKGFVFLKSGLNGPSRLYASDARATLVDADAKKLTSVNAVLEAKQFGSYEQFRFPGWNNETVHGYVLKPSEYEVGKKYPTVFLIHGGPQGSFGDGWSFRWNPQTYAGAGYAVVMIDFHGSTGYGQAFTDAISTHWGDRPLEDLRKGWAYALEKYPFLDSERAAALGASYGGFMVNWIAGNWKEPWKCLVSHDGVFDSRSMGYTTEEQWFSEWENGANVYTDPAKFDVFNPALHAKDWSVPMLIIHSDLDHRIPVEQGIGAFTALQAMGVDSRLLRFPDENHWVLKPRNSMQWHRTVFGWLEKHIGKGGR